MTQLSAKKLKLFGFNNLTKTLSFNIYDVCYTSMPDQQEDYLEHIDAYYNAQRLTRILTDVSDIIGATVLNIASQDYEPKGASVTMMIAEDEVRGDWFGNTESQTAFSNSVIAHLDKSHITAHTYPENHPHDGISTFRVDIDVSTCGEVSPLKALNHLISHFDSDIVIIDYRVRGFTRDQHGEKHFIDHDIDSIQDFIASDLRRRYEIKDFNVANENLFHTKMRLKELEIDHYLFNRRKNEFSCSELAKIERRLSQEMDEIFYGRELT